MAGAVTALPPLFALLHYRPIASSRNHLHLLWGIDNFRGPVRCPANYRQATQLVDRRQRST